MEETYTAQAIILNRQSFRENDSRVIVYTKDQGKLELVARGTKKILSKMAGHLEPINLTDIMVIKGKNFDYIGGAVNQEAYYNIKSDLAKLEIAGKGLRFFNQLVKLELSDKLIFNLLISYFDTLNSSKKIDNNLFYHFFVLKLLTKLGHQPELYYCAKCKNKINLFNISFNYAQGGLICPACPRGRHGLTISENCVKVLRFAIKNDFDQLIKLNIFAQTRVEIIKVINFFSKYNFV
ncbi:MAG: DNA repair protein RecO [Patescibacteria group bacterium]|nr:DNA repair protein RecO [Patescibacteria group bacterium]